jgi:hypothetical protein
MAGFLETGFGTRDAGKAAAHAGADAIPRPQVAVGVGLRAFAAHVLHQAAKIGEFLGAGLEFVVLVARAAVVHQLLAVGTRPLPGVEVALGERAERQCQQGVDHPAGMHRDSRRH